MTDQPTPSAARPAPARAGITRSLDDANLIFDPDTRWFSDVPLVRVGPGPTYVVRRGQLSDTEHAYLRSHLEPESAGSSGTDEEVWGVFTNNAGHTELHSVGASFFDGPRDIHTLPSALVYAGRDLPAVAGRLRHIADWIDAQIREGWVLTGCAEEGLSMTDAPDRVPRPDPSDTPDDGGLPLFYD